MHRPHVGGIHGRSNDGSYSLVLAGGFEDEVVRQPVPFTGVLFGTESERTQL